MTTLLGFLYLMNDPSDFGAFQKIILSLPLQENLPARLKSGKSAVPTYVRKNLGVLGFESLTPMGNEQYLIGMSNGYLTLDLDRVTTSKEYVIHINAISRKSNNSELEKIAKETKATFESSQNNLFFSYNVPEFDKYTEIAYQYRLDGIYDSWSDWSSKADVSFENLPFGKYTFKVRAKVGNDLSANVASYDFKIEKPWYFSNLALIVYLITFILLVVLVHKFYKRYYRRQRELLLDANKKKLKRKKLKAQKKIVQINNENLEKK